MPTTRIAQALIVAGPSGAGKSSFLRALKSGQLPPDLVAELPRDSARWHVVCAGQPHEWSILTQGDAKNGQLQGIAIHYDVTTAWRWHNCDFKQDPFWRLLRDCPEFTWVEIRPPKRRLIAQWCNFQLGAPSTHRIRLRNLYAATIKALLAFIRRLRRQMGTPAAPHWRYPRRLRFLKRLDLRLRDITPIQTSTLEFYRQPGNLEGMLDRWDEAADDMFGARLVKRMTLAPDHDSQVGRRMSWRATAVAALAPAARTARLKLN